MQMNSIKCFFLFSLIPILEGSGMLRTLDEFVPLERTVKTILESCYKNESLSNSILIWGDFNEFIENSSVIIINPRAGAAFPIEKLYGAFDFKVNLVIVVGNSSEALHSDLGKLFWSDWWNHMTSFFIIAKYQKGCEDFTDILNVSWSKQMINSVYICSESLNVTLLYTLNLMANYAPYPWERIEESDYLNVYRQVFNQRFSCENLNFDKLRHLDGYEIKVVGEVDPNLCSIAPCNNSKLEYYSESFDQVTLQSIIIALNANSRLEDERSSVAVIKRWMRNELDITRSLWALSWIPRGSCFLVTHLRSKLIGIVKLEPEVTTLHKIFKLWSTPVLIAAAIALTFLFLILIMKNYDFGLAMLDVVRLLTYTSIHTNDRTHAFRIYFTTMLIFMVISNGVFQGKIAAFLTTRERASALGTINELADLGYEMFAVGKSEIFLNKKCPNCNFKPASSRECIEHVLNNTHHLCAIWDTMYQVDYIELELDHIPEILMEDDTAYGCRKHWPLASRFNDGISRLFQTGISDYWMRNQTYAPKGNRMTMEAEWSSAKYRPVELYKLKFAFQVLAFGLLISTIVFICELYQGKCGTIRKSSIVQPTQRRRTTNTTDPMILSLRYRRSIILNGFFSEYPLTIRQDRLSHSGGISQLHSNATYQAGKLTVFQENISPLQSSPKNLR